MFPLLLSDEEEPPPDLDLLVALEEEDEPDLLRDTFPLLLLLPELLLLLVTDEDDLLPEEDLMFTDLLTRFVLFEILLVVLLMKLPTLFRKVFLSRLVFRVLTDEAGTLLLLIRCLISLLLLDVVVFTYRGSDMVRLRFWSSLTDSLLLSPLLLRVLVTDVPELDDVSRVRCTVPRLRVVDAELLSFLVRVTVALLSRVLLVPTVRGVDVEAARFPLEVTDCLSLARFESLVTVRFVPTPRGP